MHHAFKKGRKKTSKKMSVTKTLLLSSLPRTCILPAILQSLVGWRTQEGPTGHSFNVDVKTSRSRENHVCMQENCTHTHTHTHAPKSTRHCATLCFKSRCLSQMSNKSDHLQMHNQIEVNESLSVPLRLGTSFWSRFWLWLASEKYFVTCTQKRRASHYVGLNLGQFS